MCFIHLAQRASLQIAEEQTIYIQDLDFVPNG